MCACVHCTHGKVRGQRRVASHPETRNPIGQALDAKLADPQASRDPCLPRSSCTAMAGARFCVWFDVDLGYLNSDSPASVQALSHLPNPASRTLCAQVEVTERLIPLSGTCAEGKSVWPCRCVDLLCCTGPLQSSKPGTSSGATTLSLGQCLGSHWFQFPCSHLVLCGQSGDSPPLFPLRMQLLAL